MSAFTEEFLFAVAVATLAWHFYRRHKCGIVFPPLESVRNVFHEGMASGSSHKNWWTKLGGARNCMRVTVTDTEVWLRSFFQFSLLAGDFYLEHRIPLSSISSAELRNSAFRRFVLLDFNLADGSNRRVQLFLRGPDASLSSLKTPASLP